MDLNKSYCRIGQAESGEEKESSQSGEGCGLESPNAHAEREISL